MKKLFAKSCNGFFAAAAGEKSDLKPSLKWRRDLGLDKPLSTVFCDEAAGVFPEKEGQSLQRSCQSGGGTGKPACNTAADCKDDKYYSGGRNRLSDICCDERQRQHLRETGNDGKYGAQSEKDDDKKYARVEPPPRVHFPYRRQVRQAPPNRQTAEPIRYTGGLQAFFLRMIPLILLQFLQKNGKTGSRSALPVFEEIVNYLY